ncbi:MAG: metallophosphoesterase [Spirochaetales bacterium]|nr:MAG: metallophosphoesterase [Spirochaetales bacterium]
MKILCVSDEVDSVVYSPRLRERFRDVGLVLAAGDLPMEYLSYIVTVLNRPLFFVFGNHNLADLPLYSRKAHMMHPMERPADKAWGGTYVGFSVRSEAGCIVMGLGGSPRYNTGLNQYTQLEMWIKAILLVPALILNRIVHGRYVDIILTHAPPRGIHDRNDPCHEGFSAFLWLMRAFKPRYLVHGHIHLYDATEERSTAYHSTMVVNAYGHIVISQEPADV